MKNTFYAIHHRKSGSFATKRWKSKEDFFIATPGCGWQTVWLYNTVRTAKNAIIRQIKKWKSYSFQTEDQLEFFLGLEIIEVTIDYDTTKVLLSATFMADKL